MSSDLRVKYDQIGFGIERRAPYLLPKPHAHADVEMILTEHGSIEHLLGGRRMACGAGELVMFWAGVPHQSMSAPAQARCFFVHFPIAWLLEWPLPKAFVLPLLQGRVLRWPETANATAASRFKEWHGEVTPLGSNGPGIMRLELHALVQRLAFSDNPGLAPADGDAAGLKTVDVIAAYVVQRYTQPITAAEIGRAVDVHPNHAMRTFSRTFGISLWTYIGRLRVAHARHLLATTDRKITQIGLESGFNSVGRFYEVFRRETGMAPKAYRSKIFCCAV